MFRPEGLRLYKIIFIDGGESGRRVERITNLVRQQFSKEDIMIYRSASRFDQNHVHHSLKGFDIAFIHNSDNLNDKLEPVFTIDAAENKIPLVLYSGGIRGFSITDNLTCEINDSLLESHIIPFLESCIKSDNKEINFLFLFPGEKYILLEKLFQLREEAIINYESGNVNDTLQSFELFISEIKKSEEKIKLNFEPENLLSAEKFDFPTALSQMNGYILKYEKILKPI